MGKGISYLNRNFEDYRKALVEFSKTYYPDLEINFNDASVASWLIDLMASVADNESYHIDRAYQETNIDTAQEYGSLLNIARNNGVKVPGPKGAMAEVEFSCTVPSNGQDANYDYAPVIKRGTVVSSAGQKFEILNDIDFGSPSSYNNESDRTVLPINNNLYRLTKKAIVCAGETMIASYDVVSSDVKPFMEYIIPKKNIMNVESIIEVDSNHELSSNPSLDDFYCNSFRNGITRYYEVDSFCQNSVWSDKLDENNQPIFVEDSGVTIPYVTRGEWKTVDHKFITEYTVNGYLRIIFGAGGRENENVSIDSGSTLEQFSKWQMTRVLNNHNLGALPKSGSRIFVLYRIGGGSDSNVAAGAINKISKLIAVFKGSNSINSNTVASVRSSIAVTNNAPSISGKDMPTTEELRYIIKYHNAAQERCVTVKDYVDRIMQMPPKYGTPYRVGVSEVNNKIMVNLIGIDNQGHLSADIPLAVAKNIEDYLSKYRMINDYVEIKPGRIINLSFTVDVYYDGAYDMETLRNNIKNVIKNYVAVGSHVMGDSLFIGDLKKEIFNIEGVKNIGAFEVDNMYSEDETGAYSMHETSQSTIPDVIIDNGSRLDLTESMDVVYCDNDSMLEIKYPDEDIKINMIEMV